jgi:hypothetical protein
MSTGITNSISPNFGIDATETTNKVCMNVCPKLSPFHAEFLLNFRTLEDSSLTGKS